MRTWGSNTVVFSGAPVAWSNGATHAQSGDRVWWFDFSPVTRWGEYYIYDPANDTRSARFRIDQRRLRGGVEAGRAHVLLPAPGRRPKPLPYADARWTDGTNFMGPLQDSNAG